MIRLNRAQGIALGLALLLLGGVLSLAFGRIRTDQVDFNLADGSMRIRSSLLGLTFRREQIPSAMDWLGHIPVDQPGEAWVPFSITTSRIYPGHERFGKQVGMVYQDALVLAGVQCSGDALRTMVGQIRQADVATIWKLSESLRQPSPDSGGDSSLVPSSPAPPSPCSSSRPDGRIGD
jgi:hypothetical protein